jgi:hypothetical protein
MAKTKKSPSPIFAKVLAKNPRATAKEAVAACKKEGIKTSEPSFNSYKQRIKKQKKKRGGKQQATQPKGTKVGALREVLAKNPNMAYKDCPVAISTAVFYKERRAIQDGKTPVAARKTQKRRKRRAHKAVIAALL